LQQVLAAPHNYSGIKYNTDIVYFTNFDLEEGFSSFGIEYVFNSIIELN